MSRGQKSSGLGAQKKRTVSNGAKSSRASGKGSKKSGKKKGNVNSKEGKNGILPKLLVVILILVVAFALVWVFLINPNRSEKSDQNDASTSSKSIEELVAEKPHTEINSENGLIYRDNSLIVFAKDGVGQSAIEALVQQSDTTLDVSLAEYGIYFLDYDSAKTYEEIESEISRLKSDSNVEDARMNLDIMAGVDFESIPNDPWMKIDKDDNLDWNTNVPRGSNWGLEAIDAPKAWSYLDEINDVNIALIEDLPNVNHEDLEFASCECTMNKSGTAVEVDPEPSDHACHVAGIMGGSWNNGVGISGITASKGHLCYYGQLSKLERSEEDELLMDTDAKTLYKTIAALLENDVRAINYSVGYASQITFAASRGNAQAQEYIYSCANELGDYLSRLISARRSSGEQDFVVCVSAGNGNSDLFYKDEESVYGYTQVSEDGWRPENAEILGGDVDSFFNSIFSAITNEDVKDHIIVVGSVGIDGLNSDDSHTEYDYSDFSNVGSRVDVVAPGERICSCLEEGYGGKSGTSMSAPFVTGTAALLFACESSLSAAEVKEIITSTTSVDIKMPSGSSRGLLNAGAAVEKALENKQGKSSSPSSESARILSGFSLAGTWASSDGTEVTFGGDGSFSFDMPLGLSDVGTYSVLDASANPFVVDIDSDGLLALMKLLYGSGDSSYHFEILVTDGTHISLVQVYGDYTAQTSPCKLPLTKQG